MLLWIFFLPSLVLAGDQSVMGALNSVSAEASKEYSSLVTEAEQVGWVRARLAWIALERLRGQESDALKVFVGCRTYCAKHAPAGEWNAVKAWGCAKIGQKKREADVCLSLGTSGEIPTKNTKAQKSPH